MNWILIVMLGDFGLLMGIASVFGWSSGIETYLWIAIWILCAVLLAKRASGKVFLHGFLVGVIAALLNSVMTMAFFSTYILHNPKVEEAAGQMPEGFGMETALMISAPFIAAASGLILGLLTLGASKLFKKPAPPTPTTPVTPQ